MVGHLRYRDVAPGRPRCHVVQRRPRYRRYTSRDKRHLSFRKRPIGSLYCLFCSYVGSGVGQKLGSSTESLLLSAGYAMVLYEGILQTGIMATGQLLGIPVLLVMAVFYGVALEGMAVVQKKRLH